MCRTGWDGRISIFQSDGNPEFIGIQDIKNTYLPMGFTNFKIEGRGLGSALILEFLLYYMTKPGVSDPRQGKGYLAQYAGSLLRRKLLT